MVIFKYLYTSVTKEPIFPRYTRCLVELYSQGHGNKVILGHFDLEPSNASIDLLVNNQNLLNLL